MPLAFIKHSLNIVVFISEIVLAYFLAQPDCFEAGLPSFLYVAFIVFRVDVLAGCRYA